MLPYLCSCRHSCGLFCLGFGQLRNAQLELRIFLTKRSVFCLHGLLCLLRFPPPRHGEFCRVWLLVVFGVWVVPLIWESGGLMQR